MVQDKSSLIEGLVISLFEDFGPSNIFNSSPLSHVEALNLAVKGMTTLGTESPLGGDEIRSYGPIPTSKDPFVSIGFFFMLKAEKTDDQRIARMGRLIVFWIITRSNTTIKYMGMIKQTIRRILRTYKIQSDTDLRKEEILLKIDEKLRFIETGVETFYITTNRIIEPFLNLAAIPHNSPVVLIDNNSKKIDVLIREKLSPNKKMEIIHTVKDFRHKIPKGTQYKMETTTDTITIQRLLSKLGLLVHQDLSDHFRIRLTDEITFDELNEFIVEYLSSNRIKIASMIIHAFKTTKELNITELAQDTAFTEGLIKGLIEQMIKTNVLFNAKIENNILRFS